MLCDKWYQMIKGSKCLSSTSMIWILLFLMGIFSQSFHLAFCVYNIKVLWIFCFKRIKLFEYLLYGCIRMLIYIYFTFTTAKRVWDKTESTIFTTKYRICTYWWYCREIYLINIDPTFLSVATKDSLRSYGKHVSLSVMKRP